MPSIAAAAGRERRLGAGGAWHAWARALLGALAVIAGLFAGLGWTYILRGLGWLRAGAPIRDALPLLQLAGYDVQPLLRVLVAWLAAGVIVGLALRRLAPLPRALVCGLPALALLAVDSQASFALTRNVRFASVLWSRTPGLGPFLEAGLLALAAALIPPAKRAASRRRMADVRP